MADKSQKGKREARKPKKDKGKEKKLTQSSTIIEAVAQKEKT